MLKNMHGCIFLRKKICMRLFGLLLDVYALMLLRQGDMENVAVKEKSVGRTVRMG